VLQLATTEQSAQSRIIRVENFIIDSLPILENRDLRFGNLRRDHGFLMFDTEYESDAERNWEHD
jgi:hypothetical protein